MEINKLNILKTPQVQSKGKSSDTPRADVQDVLGARLEMTPDMLALLKQEGKVSEGEFQELLLALDNQGEAPETVFGSKTSKTDLLKLLKSEAELSPAELEPSEKVLKETIVPLKNKNNTEVPNQKDKKLTLSDFMLNGKQSTPAKIAKLGSYQVAGNKSLISTLKDVKSSEANVASENSKTVSLQDIMFAGGAEQSGAESQNDNSDSSAQIFKMASKVSSDNSAKVFDMASLSQGSGSEEVISKIQDYIIQTKAGNEKQVEFSFQHKELGQVGLSVQKESGNALNIVITTNSAEGAKFFNQTQGELLHSLTQAGVQVGDLKLDSAKSGAGQDPSHDSSKQFAGNSKDERNSESGEREQEQDRRRSLWEQFSQDQVAA